MGHIRLGTLPKTHKREHVVGLIAGGADVERIAAASAGAAEHGLERASHDQGLAHAFWRLTQIPQAARQTNFADRLWQLGLNGSSRPTLLEIVARSRVRSIAMFATAAIEAISAKWHSILLQKP